MRTRPAWALLAAGSVAIGIAALLLPLNSTERCTAGPYGAAPCTTSSTSLLQNEGFSVALPLAVPALLCVIALVVARRRVSFLMAFTLVAFCILAAMTVGVLFTPIAIGAVVAAAKAPGGPVRRRPAPARRPHGARATR